MKSTVYFGYTTYGNYLENYYTDNYNILIQDLIEQFSHDNPEMIQEVNLGITDGVAIKNNFKGDFTKFNTAIVVRTINGVQESDLYFIISKTFVRRDIWSITLMKDVISKYYQEIINGDISVNRIGLKDRTKYSELMLLNEGIDVSNVKRKQILLEDTNYRPCYAIFYTNKSTDDPISIDMTKHKKTSGELTPELEGNFNSSRHGKILRIVKTFHFASFVSYTDMITHTITYTFNIKNRNDYWELETEVEYCELPAWEQIPVSSFTGKYAQWDSRLDAINWDSHKNKVHEYMWNALNYETPEIKTRVLDYMSNKNRYEIYHNTYMTKNGDEYFIENKDIITNDYPSVMPYSDMENFINEDFNTRLITVYPEEGIPYYSSNRWSWILTSTELQEIYENGLWYAFSEEVEPDKWRIIIDEFQYRYNTTSYTYSPYESEYKNPIIIPKVDNCKDQPYGIIMIPQEFIYRTEIVTKEDIEDILYSLSAQYGGNNGRVIDIQHIPYGVISCRKDGEYYEPWENYTGTIKVEKKNNRTYYIPYATIENTYFTKTIPFNLQEHIVDFPYYNDKKLLDYYKILIKSPSGANVWEINALKNGGNIEEFTIGYNLRPVMSYYRLIPKLGGIYGENYKDIRGLIWSENRSITLISDAYYTYRRQNLNYLNQFNANINYQKNELELIHEANHMNFKFDSGKRKLEGYIGAMSAPIEGAAAGSIMGPYGALAGAAAGTVQGIGEAIGTAVSEGIEKRQMLANEKYDIRLLNNRIENDRRQFNYNISNIKAIPINVEKITGIYFTDNEFPYIEVYSPTNTELEHLKQYFDLYGVNVGKIIDLSQYDFNYLQASIIRLKTEITIEEYDEINHKLNVGVRKEV